MALHNELPVRNKLKVCTKRNGTKIKTVELNGQKISIHDISVVKKIGHETIVQITLPVDVLTWITDQTDS